MKPYDILALCTCLLLITSFAGCQQEAEAPAKRPNLVKRKTQVVVNYTLATEENPKLYEVENTITGKDPLSTSLEGYVAASSKVNKMQMQHQINLMKAPTGVNPTHEELMDAIKNNNIQLNALPDYQMYAYNEETGEFLILEDPEAKEEFQKEAQR